MAEKRGTCPCGNSFNRASKGGAEGICSECYFGKKRRYVTNVDMTLCDRCEQFRERTSFGVNDALCRWCREDVDAMHAPPPTGVLPTRAPAPRPPEDAMPGDFFQCLPLKARLRYRHCSERQQPKVNGERLRPPCNEGDGCEQGKLNVEVLGLVALGPQKTPPRLDLVGHQKEPTMPQEKPEPQICREPGCTTELRSNNGTGKCREHVSWRDYQKGEKAPAKSTALAKPRRRPAPVVEVLEAPRLPTPAELPDAYLVECVAEASARARRIREETERRCRLLEEGVANAVRVNEKASAA